MNGTKGFAPATRLQAHARLAFVGPAKSGKTFSALRVAQYLGNRIALIDTERRSASKYVGEPEIPAFDVLELETFSPDDYIAAITMAAHEHYPVLIIDSISHAWMGTGGVLEIVDTATSRATSRNAYTSGWREATPMHNKLVEAMLHYPGHLIVTVRTKSRYIMETDRSGKQVPKKVGMEWVQRDGMEYEFDVVGELDTEHTMVIHETRCRALDGRVFAQPGEDLALPLVEWLSIGAPDIPRPQPERPTSAQAPQASRTTPAGKPTADEVTQLLELMRRAYEDEGVVDQELRRVLQIPIGQEMRPPRVKNTMTRAHLTTLQDAATAYVLMHKMPPDDTDDGPVYSGPTDATPPQGETSQDGEGGGSPVETSLRSEAPDVTDAQLDDLELLAGRISPEAVAEVQLMRTRHRPVALTTYQETRNRLLTLQAERQAQEVSRS